MKTKIYTPSGMKKLLSTPPVPGSFNVFSVNGSIYKIYKDLMFDLQRFGHVIMPFSLVNEEQIRLLHSKQPRIKETKLPEGIIYYEEYPIGVIYPVYFKNYHTFNTLYLEESKLMISNLRKAINKNIRLMEMGIYNSDFTMNNILYKGNDVQLIDLDGKYIYNYLSYYKAYTYFMYGMLKLFKQKVEEQYNSTDASLAWDEIRERIDMLPIDIVEKDYPHIVLDEIDKSRILK